MGEDVAMLLVSAGPTELVDGLMSRNDMFAHGLMSVSAIVAHARGNGSPSISTVECAHLQYTERRVSRNS